MPPELTLGDRRIGPGHPCFIIAEAGVNHNGRLDLALKLVDVAVEAGADAVKFQKRRLDSLYPPELLADPNSAEWAFQYMLPILKQVELSDDDFREIKSYCDQQGIQFLCTPWDAESLAFLEELGVDIYKVASADLVNTPLLEQIAGTGKPLILSTGMATLDEITTAVHFLLDLDVSFGLLHCVSTYPAPFENLNLHFINTLRQFGVPVGYSGHERGIVIPVVAVALGACIIEKHITVDRTLPGPDHAASLEPLGLQRLVRDIRNAELALDGPGHEKQLSSMERLNLQVLRKSLVAAEDIAAGAIVTHAHVKVQGPGKGLSPQRVDELIGARLRRAVPEGAPFVESDLWQEGAPSLQRANLRRPWGLKARFYDLHDILARKPRLVELHFSAADVDYAFEAPSSPYPQQLFIHAPEFADSRLLNLCSPDDEVHETAVALLQRTIDKAVELQPHFQGPVGIVIHVGGMSMDEYRGDRHRLLQRAVDGFRRLDPRGTLLMPENLPPRPWYLGGQWFQNIFIRAEEMVEFCQELGLGMTLDISHAQLYCNAYDDSLIDYTRRCLPYVHHLHLADAAGLDSEGLQIGEGVVAWDELLALLAQEEFSWVPEIWSGHLDHAAGFVEAVNRLGAYEIL